MTIGEKIKQKRIEHGYSIQYVADMVGKSRSSVSRYESEDTEKVPLGIIDKLATVLGTTREYLCGWDEIPTPTTGHWIPVLGKVAAGIPLEMIEDVLDYEEITDEQAKAPCFALKIEGQSMEPKISDGDVVIVRQQDDAESGEIAVVSVNGDAATVKRIKKDPSGLWLIPTNPAFAPVFYSTEQVNTLPVRILGKVIELRAKF